jgi:hypothetical protein
MYIRYLKNAHYAVTKPNNFPETWNLKVQKNLGKMSFGLRINAIEPNESSLY